MSKVTSFTDRCLFQSLFLLLAAEVSSYLERSNSCLEVYKGMCASILDDDIRYEKIKNRLELPDVNPQPLQATKKNIIAKIEEFCKNSEEKRVPVFSHFYFEYKVGDTVKVVPSFVAIVPMKHDFISVLVCPQMLQFKATKDAVANELFNILQINAMPEKTQDTCFSQHIYDI